MTKKYPRLSQILKKLLFSKNMKPMDLARELQIPQPTIHRLVTGKTTRPYRSSLEPIANYFSVTLEELLGEVPLQQESNSVVPAPSFSQLQSKLIPIPLLPWAPIDTLETALSAHEPSIVASHVSPMAFALVMPDSSMAPIFPRHSVLIFDPQVIPQDRNYVLVQQHMSPSLLFRQLLVDADKKYLKPLNPDLNQFEMRLLHKDDKILGCLVESRLIHTPSG